MATGVILALKATGKQDVAAGGKSAEQIAIMLGIASFVLIVLRLVTEPSFMAFGLFIGIAAAAVVAYGAWKASKEAGAVAPTTAGTTPAPPTL